MYKLCSEKAEEPENKSYREQTDIHWIIGKTREFQKNIYLCFFDYAKAFNYVDHNKLWKIFSRDGNTRPSCLPPEKPVCRLKATVRNGHGTTDWFQIGKGVG